MASRRKQKKLRNKLARQRSKDGLSDTFHIAVCGDVHGHQKTMVRKLNALSEQLNLQFDLARIYPKNSERKSLVQ